MRKAVWILPIIAAIIAAVLLSRQQHAGSRADSENSPTATTQIETSEPVSAIGSPLPKLAPSASQSSTGKRGPANYLKEIGAAPSEQGRLVLLTEWTAQNPNAAFAWLIEAYPGMGFAPAYKTFFRQLLSTHPNRLSNFLLRIHARSSEFPEADSTAESRGRIGVRNIVYWLLEQSVGTETPRALLNLRDELPSELAQSIEFGIARNWASRTDRIDQVAKWLEDSDTPPSARLSTFRMVLDHWTRQEPIEAADWAVGAIKSGDLPADVMSAIAFRWGQMDASSAFEWLNLEAHADSTWVDPAIGSLVLGVAAESPGTAIRWAEEIRDEQAKKKMLSALPKWTWDNKNEWDAAVIDHLASENSKTPESITTEAWLETLHSDSAREQATQRLQQE